MKKNRDKYRNSSPKNLVNKNKDLPLQSKSALRLMHRGAIETCVDSWTKKGILEFISEIQDITETVRVPSGPPFIIEEKTIWSGSSAG